jgi:hypothetical protein
MVKERRHAAEPFGAKKLLIIEITVWFPELGVPLERDFAECMIKRHGYMGYH